MKKPHVLPLAIASCVALALAACDSKSNADNAAKESQLRELQSKIETLNSRSDALSRQIAERDAAQAEAQRQQLEKDRAEVEQEKARLAEDREALAKATPAPVADDVSNDEPEQVATGKPAKYDVFYTKLQNDGNWIDSDDYGYIWRPNVAVRDSRWRPYTDGRWVETERGWTWDSNERFGWATYHYGRWVDLGGSGWCWVPGNEWAPAWVSWRSSDQYVGWAPLQPEARLERGGRIDASVDVAYDTGPGAYSFVNTEDFGEDTYIGRVVAPERNITIIDQTVNVTNITYDQTVINNFGPDYDRIGLRSRRPVRRYQLALDRRSDFADDETRRHDGGNRLALVAPVFAANTREDRDVRPAKVEKKIIKAPRENGWRGVNPAQKEVVQAQLRKKADQQTQQQQVAVQNQRRQQARAQRIQAAQNQAQTAAQPNPPPAQPPVAPNPAVESTTRPANRGPVVTANPQPPRENAPQRDPARPQVRRPAAQTPAVPTAPANVVQESAPVPSEELPAAKQLQQQAANRARQAREAQARAQAQQAASAANQQRAAQANQARAAQAAQAQALAPARRQQAARQQASQVVETPRQPEAPQRQGRPQAPAREQVQEKNPSASRSQAPAAEATPTDKDDKRGKKRKSDKEPQ